MIRNLLKGSMPVFFLGAAAGLCLFNITFGTAVEHVVVERTSGMALLFAFIGGFAGGWSEANTPEAQTKLAIPAWKRALLGIVALLTAVVAFGFTAFSMSYNGIIEPFVTMFASILGIVFSLVSGFVTIWTLSSTSTVKEVAGKELPELATPSMPNVEQPAAPGLQPIVA